MEEIWKDVKKTSGRYKISSMGHLRKKTNVDGEYIEVKPHSDRFGYLYVSIKFDDCPKAKHVAIHRLVAEAFINNPYNLPIVHHIDDNKRNNSVSNLFWCTHGQNHSFSLSARKGNVIKDRVIEQYALDGTLLATYTSFRSASDAIGVKNTNLISKCCRNIQGRKSAYGFVWRFGVGDKMYRTELKDINADHLSIIMEAYSKFPNEVIETLKAMIDKEGTTTQNLSDCGICDEEPRYPVYDKLTD